MAADAGQYLGALRRLPRGQPLLRPGGQKAAHPRRTPPTTLRSEGQASVQVARGDDGDVPQGTRRTLLLHGGPHLSPPLAVAPATVAVAPVTVATARTSASGQGSLHELTAVPDVRRSCGAETPASRSAIGDVSAVGFLMPIVEHNSPCGRCFKLEWQDH